jgi:23S rRNA (uracil1939-C5)-methyltransferase
MEFTFQPGGGLGLHRRGAFDELVAVTRCLIQPDAANTALEALRTWAAGAGLPAYDPRTRTGLLRQAVIRQARRTGEMMVAVVATAPRVPGANALAADLCRRIPGMASVLLAVNPGASDGLPLQRVSVLAGRPFIVEELAGHRFKVGLETFFQTNTEQAERLVDCVLDFAEAADGSVVFDLYAGVGTFSLPLARRAARVYGVETSAAAVRAAADNAAWNEVPNVEFIAGEVRRVMPDLVARAGRADVIVLDPPRSGAGRRVMRKIAAAAPRRIVYISCNPTTLAPDLADLVEAGYAVRAVQPVDLFPQTYHVECVVRLDRTP